MTIGHRGLKVMGQANVVGLTLTEGIFSSLLKVVWSCDKLLEQQKGYQLVNLHQSTTPHFARPFANSA